MLCHTSCRSRPGSVCAPLQALVARQSALDVCPPENLLGHTGFSRRDRSRPGLRSGQFEPFHAEMSIPPNCLRLNAVDAAPARRRAPLDISIILIITNEIKERLRRAFCPAWLTQHGMVKYLLPRTPIHLYMRDQPIIPDLRMHTARRAPERVPFRRPDTILDETASQTIARASSM